MATRRRKKRRRSQANRRLASVLAAAVLVVVALIGVLAIPAAVLLGLIAGVWTLTDRLTALLNAG